jgi:hypothetical protein
MQSPEYPGRFTSQSLLGRGPLCADRGYYKGEEIRACHLDGIKVLVQQRDN